MKENSIILIKLDELRLIVKKAKTGGDLYTSFKHYRDFVLENWPDNMPDLGNWRSEMEFTIEKLELKKNVKSVLGSKDLPSFKQDAEDVMHQINGKFQFHFNKPEVS